jgi:hypothetical protein
MSTHGSVLGDPTLASLARLGTSPSRAGSGGGGGGGSSSGPQRPGSPSRGFSYRSASPPRSDVVPVGYGSNFGSVTGGSRPTSVVFGSRPTSVAGSSRPDSSPPRGALERLSPVHGARTLSPEPFERRSSGESEDGASFAVAL